MTGENIELFLCRHGHGERVAYDRLLGDAMRGDAALFARQDGVEAAWRIVDPILGNAAPIHPYEPGTWGPDEAEAMTATVGGWQAPKRTS